MLPNVEKNLYDGLQVGLHVGPDLLALSTVEILEREKVYHSLRFLFSYLANALLSVEIQHGLSAGLEHLQPVPNRLGLVILSLDQVLASLVILASNL